ncbi:hypothetical protein Tco_0052239 [Tanacetum coccineum]
MAKQFKALQEQVMEQKKRMDEFIAFKVSNADEKSASAHVINEVKNQVPTLVPDVVVGFIRPRIHITVLHVLRTKHITLTTTARMPTTNSTIPELKEQLLYMMSNDLDSMEANLRKRPHDDQDPPVNHEGEKSHKKQKFAGESSLGKDQITSESNDYERQPSSTKKIRKSKDWFDRAPAEYTDYQ